jgi:hypothetical protein
MRCDSRTPALRGRLILGGVLACVCLALTIPVRGTIVGSKHDFSGLNSEQRICIFCHTPHDADTSVIDAPLWNHQVTNRSYLLYDSPTLDARVDQPTGGSKLCLSCHDGSVAVDSYGGRSGTIFMLPPAAVAGDIDELSNDHPISFTYDDALASQDGGLFAPTSTASGLGGTISQNMLFNDRLECSSCHDVHNGPAAAAVNDHLLVITQVQSRLCLTCHDK